jgi:hypothetical protein
VSNTSVETILKLSGRLPFATQTAASLRQELLEGGCSEQKALERLEGEFRERMRERFSRYWEHFTPAEQAELTRRARARDRFLPVDEKDEAERSLKLYGFLQPQAASTELYEISGDVFRDWIRAQA